MKAQLEAAGNAMTGIDVAHSVCQGWMWRLFPARQADVAEAEVVLVLSWSRVAIGARRHRQAGHRHYRHPVPGQLKRQLDYGKCTLCGDCVIDRFGGICPHCPLPKAANGPWR